MSNNAEKCKNISKNLDIKIILNDQFALKIDDILKKIVKYVHKITKPCYNNCTIKYKR